jgi:hypothetical protein
MLLLTIGSALGQESRETMQKTRIAEACRVEMKLSVAGCNCLADRALADLNDVQREYLLATAISPSAAERMREQVSQDDIQILARFLGSAGQECSAD